MHDLETIIAINEKAAKQRAKPETTRGSRLTVPATVYAQGKQMKLR